MPLSIMAILRRPGMGAAMLASMTVLATMDVLVVYPGLTITLIILAAKRSKQLQRGATPRIEIDPQKHKPTRIALEEVMRGRVHFAIKEDGDKESE